MAKTKQDSGEDGGEELFTREVIGSIVLGRDGKRIKLTTGMVFDFTKEELDAINASNPNAVSSKIVVDIDSADADLSLRETVLQSNQTQAPDGKGTTEKAPKTAAAKKAAAAKSATDDEL